MKAQLKSKELERWRNSSEGMYMMNYDKILDEILEVLNDYANARGKNPSSITINSDFKNTLEYHSALYSVVSDYKSKPTTILGVPLKFERSPDYDYMVE